MSGDVRWSYVGLAKWNRIFCWYHCSLDTALFISFLGCNRPEGCCPRGLDFTVESGLSRSCKDVWRSEQYLRPAVHWSLVTVAVGKRHSVPSLCGQISTACRWPFNPITVMITRYSNGLFLTWVVTIELETQCYSLTLDRVTMYGKPARKPNVKCRRRLFGNF